MKKSKLTAKQEAFINEYMISNNATQAAIKAGYSAKTVARSTNKILNNSEVASEIQRRREAIQNEKIATAQQVMEYFTQVMNGEIKDQFGLEASLAERTKAATELARRTIDLENRTKGKADAVVEIKLDWKRD